MRELSIEEKAKAYDKALEKLRDFYRDYDIVSCLIDVKEELANIFPELKESGDEKTRKEIMDFIDTKTIDSDERRNRWFSYLEKYKPIPFTSLEDTKVKMSLMQYISELNQDVVHLHPGIETCNEWTAWLEKQGKETSWKPSKEEMDVLYGLAYITNQYDEHKEEVITRLYQDLKREFFNGSSYENMFPNTEDAVRRRSTIQVLEYARSLDNYNQFGKADIDKNIAWLEKQGEQKPNYCHHEVDLSNCSDEYRKAYYDGWNNCNMQHSQCKSDGNAVVKCLINGLNFYYERDEEAYWGTAKFPMKIKDILSWLQKQLETN